jgi:hypothetical protein
VHTCRPRAPPHHRAGRIGTNPPGRTLLAERPDVGGEPKTAPQQISMFPTSGVSSGRGLHLHRVSTRKFAHTTPPIRVSRIPAPEEPPCRRPSFHYKLGEPAPVDGWAGVCGGTPSQGNFREDHGIGVAGLRACRIGMPGVPASPSKPDWASPCALGWSKRGICRPFASSEGSTRSSILDRPSRPSRSARPCTRGRQHRKKSRQI